VAPPFKRQLALEPGAATIERLVELGVSRETTVRLEAYVRLLEQWQSRINLISPHTLAEVWSRHILDSAQLVLLYPEARRWLDLGSGGGLPGLVIGCLLADKPGARVDLVESNLKKSAFLRHVAETLDLQVSVHAGRIETVIETLPTPEIVTARALASLDQLLGYTNLLLKRGALGLFPKGRDHLRELTEAHANWHFSHQLRESITDREARIVEVRMTSA
jgi:16S rRNA (guanine527-N7)-methyltransferase